MANATGYLLEVQDVTAATAIKTYPISSGLTTSYPLSALNAGDAYQWNMYTYDGSVTSQASPWNYFTIQASGLPRR